MSRRGAGVALVLLTGAGCATLAPPPPGAPEAALRAPTYSASLRVSLKGPSLRARTPAIVAFRRPDALRVEVPGPAGPRVVAVTRDARLTAVFPASRAVFRSAADPASFEALFGIGLGPAEVMDLLVGRPSPRLRAYEAGWGPSLPRTVRATLPDGGRLSLSIDEAEAGVPVPDAAFDPPPAPGYRPVDADEARRLWGGR